MLCPYVYVYLLLFPVPFKQNHDVRGIVFAGDGLQRADTQKTKSGTLPECMHAKKIILKQIYLLFLKSVPC